MGFWSKILGRSYPSLAWETPGNYVRASVTEIPAVVRAINMIAADFARCPILVQTVEGDRAEITSGVSLLSDQAWGDNLTGADLRRWMAAECLTTGNAFAVIVLDDQAVPVALRPIATSDVMMQQQTDGSIAWTYQNQPFDYGLVLHFKAVATTGNPYWGTSPLSAASTTLNGLAQLEAVFAAYAAGGALGKLGFSHPGALQPAVRDAMRTAYLTQHGSAAAAATPLFIGEGMKVEPIAPQMATELAASRAAGTKQIAALLGVPSAYLEGSDARTQAEIAQQYLACCLEVWSASWMSEITSKLASPGTRVSVDFSPVTMGSLQTAGRAYSALVQIGALTPNDVRKRLGFAPLSGLDVAAPIISGITPPLDAATQDGGQSNA